jgi:hypothetical protein
MHDLEISAWTHISKDLQIVFLVTLNFLCICYNKSVRPIKHHLISCQGSLMVIAYLRYSVAEAIVTAAAQLGFPWPSKTFSSYSGVVKIRTIHIFTVALMHHGLIHVDLVLKRHSTVSVLIVFNSPKNKTHNRQKMLSSTCSWRLFSLLTAFTAAVLVKTIMQKSLKLDMLQDNYVPIEMAVRYGFN